MEKKSDIVQYKIDTPESAQDLISCINDGSLKIITQNENILHAVLDDKEVKFDVQVDLPIPTIENIIHGKDKTEKIVNIAVKDDMVFLYKNVDGVIVEETRDFKYFVAARHKPNDSFTKLNGQSYYNYIKFFI